MNKERLELLRNSIRDEDVEYYKEAMAYAAEKLVDILIQKAELGRKKKESIYGLDKKDHEQFIFDFFESSGRKSFTIDDLFNYIVKTKKLKSTTAKHYMHKRIPENFVLSALEKGRISLDGRTITILYLPKESFYELARNKWTTFGYKEEAIKEKLTRLTVPEMSKEDYETMYLTAINFLRADAGLKQIDFEEGERP